MSSIPDARRYDGTWKPGTYLAGDPWLETPEGEVVDLAPHLATLERGDCGDCRAGFFAPTDNGPTEQGVERCDECDAYDGDLEAALALAALIGPDVTVRYVAHDYETEGV